MRICELASRQRALHLWTLVAEGLFLLVPRGVTLEYKAGGKLVTFGEVHIQSRPYIKNTGLPASRTTATEWIANSSIRPALMNCAANMGSATNVSCPFHPALISWYRVQQIAAIAFGAAMNVR
ncbi:hypothetical protein [Devosia psychrophila]|uniref:Uncharacterized protein n=1 Tax=Devosia psychrophila TaxID=728005 RepID=A0A1I1RNK4_9HYPH|nr:hypothetical protein [Devosia psychrophila]SFD35904.1 hypothetical protein SAMN04488059_14510 [Devosia psychrophila]